jgi:hypothetical protein
VKGHQNGADIQLYVFSEMDHNHFLPIFMI